MSLLFLCLPLLQEFSTLQSQNGTIYNAPYDLYPNLNYSMTHGWQATSTRIKACKDYRQCPWYDLETLPSQAFLEPDASQSEITRAKETYLTMYGSGSQNIDYCFTSLILSMRKEYKDCNSIYSMYFKEYLNKFGLRKDVPQNETTPFLMDLLEKEGVSPNYFKQCLDYKFSNGIGSNSVTSLMTLDAPSKLPFKIVCCIISIFGLLGNLALFVIYVRKDRKVRFNSLMLLIMTFDSFFIVCGVANMVIELTESSEDNILVKVITFLYHFTFTGSVSTTTLVAIERYLILCKEK